MQNDPSIITPSSGKLMPGSIEFYNDARGVGVDCMSLMAQSTTTKRQSRSRRWLNIKFFNSLDVACVEASSVACVEASIVPIRKASSKDKH